MPSSVTASSGTISSSISGEASTMVGSLVAFGTVAMLLTRMKRQASSTEDLLDNNDNDYSSSSSDYNSFYNTEDEKRFAKQVEQDEYFIQNLPKIELHVHLDGAFDPEELWNHLLHHPELIMCLPVEKNLPWSHANDPPLFIRDMVKACQSPTEFRQLCTCRRRYRSLREFQATNATAAISQVQQQQHQIHKPSFLPHYHKRSETTGSLTDMLTCFEFFLPLVCDNLALLESLAYDFVKRQAEQHVIYSEVRYSPHYLAQDPKQAHSAITKGLRRGCEEYPDIIVNQILCAINFQPNWSDEVVTMASTLRNDYPCAVVGVDIASGEDHFVPNSTLYQGHYDMCQKAQRMGLNITLHAGETPSSAQNVVTAIQQYGAKRIGHGYHITESPDILQLVKSQKIHMEVCPTSSVETGGWDKELIRKTIATTTSATTTTTTTTTSVVGGRPEPWKYHPANIFREYGISQSLNSDDPAVFNTSLTWQYRIAHKKMGWTRNELIQMTRDSVQASFLLPLDKQRLSERLEKELLHVDNKMKHGDIILNKNHHYKDRVHYE